MRKSRLLLSGVAVAAAAAASSAFTASNTFNTLDNNVAGYGEMVASGVNVSNIAYAPAALDASKLHSVVFTVDKDTTSMSAVMTLTSGGAATATNSASSCLSTATAGPVYKITCDLTADVAFTAFDKTALTVTSN
jgi:hypothetical protein